MFNLKVGNVRVETAFNALAGLLLIAVLLFGWFVFAIVREGREEAARYKAWCLQAGGEVITTSSPWLCVKPNSLIQRK